MPGAVGAFIAKIGFLIVSGLTAVGVPFTAAVAILDYGIKLAALSFLGWVSDKLAGVPDFADTVRGTQILVRGTVEHQRIIIGETLVGGVLQYINASGDHNQLLHESIVLAGHECEDVTDVWFDDVRIPESSIDWDDTGKVLTGSYAGSPAGSAVRFEKHLGGADQAASALLVANFAEVTSQHQGRGMTYTVAQLNYDSGNEDTWTKGEPNDIKFLVKGWKVYDPRSDSTTSFGTGPCRVNSPATWRWSKNSALSWARYMIDEDLGVGEDPQWIDWGYVASAAEVCDGVVHTPVGTSARYECNGVLSTGATHEDNLRAILSSFNGSMAEVNGVYKLRAYAYDTPTLETLTDDYLRDDIQITLDNEPEDRFNTVRGVFVDKDRQYKPLPFPPFTSSEYVARDNGEKLYHDIQLPMTTDIFMAQRLAAGILEQGNLMAKVIYPSNFRTTPAEVNGTIKLSNEEMEWEDQPFRVERYVFKDLEGVDLILRIDDPDAYADVGTAEYSVSSNGVYTTPNPGVPPPSSLWAESYTDGVLVRWTPPAARLYETTRIYWSTNNSRDQAIQVADVRGAEFMHRTERPQTGYYWARSRNYAGTLSDFFPNSGQTDVVARPSLSGTHADYKFDFSDDLRAFWDPNTTYMTSDYVYFKTFAYGSASIVTGEDSGGALRFTASVGSVVAHVPTIFERTVHPIAGELTDIIVSYIPRSLDDGTASVASVSGMYCKLTGWGASPLLDSGGAGGGGSGKPQPDVSSWQQLHQEERRLPYDKMVSVGARGLHKFSFVNSAFSVNGAKYVRAEIGYTFDNDMDIMIDIDQLSVTFGAQKTHEGYQIKDIADTVSSSKLALSYEAGNSHYVRVGANVNSITVTGWPSSGTLGEMAITFQRSGSSTAVVSTTAWPSAVRWNGGARFVLTTNSGGYGRVLLSTRDGGSTILADKADGYT